MIIFKYVYFMSLSHYFLSKNNVRNKNAEFQLENYLDFPCDQENLFLYIWTTPNMIILLAELHPGQFEHTGKHAYFEKSPGNEDCVGLQNVL